MNKYINLILNSDLDIDEIREMFESEVPHGDFETLLSEVPELN